MSHKLEDLDPEDASWLDRLSDGRAHVVPTTIAERLQSLGLVEQVSPKSEEIAPELKMESLGTRINENGLRLLQPDE